MGLRSVYIYSKVTNVNFVWLLMTMFVTSWWRYQKEAFFVSLPFVRGIHRWSVNSPHKDHWRGALTFSLIYAWINVWVNTRDAGGLKSHRAHNDVTVMWYHLQIMKLEKKEPVPVELIFKLPESLYNNDTVHDEYNVDYIWKVFCHSDVLFV